MNNLHRQILIQIESNWNERICYLVNENRLDDADALYEEFIIEEGPEEWMFVEDLDAVL